ncbi:MAG: Ldh family oxidoreductase [Chloroflexi bacterium]|nr:Ldh family oxidoreductase [Chloroflexota bacterium]
MSNTTSQSAMSQAIAWDRLQSFVQNVLVCADVPAQDAAIVAECLVTANLSGIDTHGVVRLAHYIRRLANGSIKTHPRLNFEQVAPGMGVMDGDDGLGHVVTFAACTEAMRMARETGSSSVIVKNSSHFGMTGYYIKHMVEQGFVAMMMTATDAFLIPFGGRKPFFGTNPIAIGFPTEGIPLILDMATTSIPYGKITLAKTEGKSIPPDWGFDAEGNPTTDPNAIAGLHPIAGPKGSGLAMVIDIFCSLLAGMPWGPHINKMYTEMEQPRKLGHFIAVWDISKLMPVEVFKANLAAMIGELNAIPPAQGFTKVYYPGQVEGEKRELRRAQGIPIDPGLYRELIQVGAQFGITL